MNKKMQRKCKRYFKINRNTHCFTDNSPLELRYIKSMLSEVHSLGQYYPVDVVHEKVSINLDMNMFTIMCIYSDLCKAGFLNEEIISVAVNSELSVPVKVYSFTVKTTEIMRNDWKKSATMRMYLKLFC